MTFAGVAGSVARLLLSFFAGLDYWQPYACQERGCKRISVPSEVT